MNRSRLVISAQMTTKLPYKTFELTSMMRRKITDEARRVFASLAYMGDLESV